MSLSKKHFKAIAEIIRTDIKSRETINQMQLEESRTAESNNLVIERITRQLREYFASENPLFDRQRFLNACGIGNAD